MGLMIALTRLFESLLIISVRCPGHAKPPESPAKVTPCLDIVGGETDSLTEAMRCKVGLPLLAIANTQFAIHHRVVRVESHHALQDGLSLTILAKVTVSNPELQ